MKTVVTAGWDHVPHLSPAAIASMEAEYPEHELEARRNGTPTLGAGKIYQISEEDFVVDDFAIPDHWFRSYGLDVGIRRTAAVWAAEDRDADVVYFYSEHYAGDSIPAVHADAIKARGDWIKGVIDPAARGRSPNDGEQLVELYRRAGLDIEYANNSVEAGIYTVRQRLIGGKLKVFRSLTNFLAECRLYRRDDKGKVVKEKDHLMDAGRYEIMSGLARGEQRTKPSPEPDPYSVSDYGGTGWMA